MQPCDACHACSFPDKVAEAKATLPSQWLDELTEEEAPDHIWVVALNLRSTLVEKGVEVPASFLQAVSGGEITEDDRAWAVAALTFGEEPYANRSR